MKVTPLRTLLAGGALGTAMLVGAVTLGPADAAKTSTPKANSTAGSTRADSNARRGDHPHPFANITDAQKKCLADAGFTRPATRPTTRPTEAQIKAFRAAAKKCGITLPDHAGMGHPGMGHGGMGHGAPEGDTAPVQ